MGLEINRIFSNKAFLVGLIVKLFFLMVMTPIIHNLWFIPFYEAFFLNPSFSPWSNFLDSGGDILSFPYGPIMFIALLPVTFIGWFLDNMFSITYFIHFGFGLNILIADILLLTILLKLFNDRRRKIIVYYWLSPIVFFINFWHGQLDLIPISILFLSLILIKNQNYKYGGIILGLSVATKYSMLIGVPIIFIYLWLNQNIRGGFWETLQSFLAVISVTFIHAILSNGFIEMVINNREVDKLYSLSITLGTDFTIYILPVFYLLFLYYAFRMLRMNFDLLMSTLAVGFSIIIFLTPSPPGWLLWLAPLYAIHQSRNDGGANYLIALFSIVFIFYHFIYSSGAKFLINLDVIGLSSFFIFMEEIISKSMIYTLLVTFGAFLGIQIYREGIKRNNYYHLGLRPMVIGIAGDSGTGKTTFSDSVIKLFGLSATAHLKGDDYHAWDRQSPMWNSFTHLHPQANRLFELVKDLRLLIIGNNISAVSYDHKTGSFLPPKRQKSKNLIIISGLHSLYLRSLLDEIDRSFFLTMDERLRVLLKIERDKERGRSADYTKEQIKKRANDSEKYIHPQSERADVIYKLIPVNYNDLSNETIDDINLKLQVKIKSCTYYDELIKALIGICNLNVNLNNIDDIGGVDIEIQGDVSKEDILLATRYLAPNIEELIDIKNGFSEGMLGVMELIALIEINEHLSAISRRYYA